MFLEFFDGILGHYTFESDKVNVLIDGLPSFAYPLGQLTFLVLAYWLFIHRYLKKFKKMSPQDIWRPPGGSYTSHKNRCLTSLPKQSGTVQSPGPGPHKSCRPSPKWYPFPRCPDRIPHAPHR